MKTSKLNPSSNPLLKLKHKSAVSRAKLQSKSPGEEDDLKLGHYASKGLRRKSMAKSKKLKEAKLQYLNSLKEAYENELISEEAFVTLAKPILEGSMGFKRLGRKITSKKVGNFSKDKQDLKSISKVMTKKKFRKDNAQAKASIDHHEAGEDHKNMRFPKL